MKEYGRSRSGKLTDPGVLNGLVSDFQAVCAGAAVEPNEVSFRQAACRIPGLWHSAFYFTMEDE